ncbi:DUF547 domain-containing protein [candidate division KSB1 bacterium]|nr:DUF547 domain-containing protein [candidate division KSB1 bacterium]NIR72039.1 DUF547 domain-containing protein [candidate division KSB1 bacterium]NIS25980.1 DUF547 domain-containing protein [candidate division KSB1 bacterium]NIT74951.1 DUF547 domain-containing protein [candidate division KSB1 bacterium]NIU28735.1 DUF547 domain-containing protein [candidate division KSB1 bacterium]
MRYFTSICFILLTISGYVHLSDGRHELFDRALQRHVKDGLVDYEAMAEEEDFKRYVGWVKNVNVDSFKSRTEEMAFWVNAYNAMAILGVIQNYPLEKVIDVEGFFDKNKHAVAGDKYTLDQIEKEILFKKFDEPRLHFLLVCAAKSCPNLPSEAYTGENIKNKMENVTRTFLNNSGKNRLDKEENVFYLSQIFNWYRKDFVTKKESVLDFIKPYLSEEKQEYLEQKEVTVEYLKYDWSLNEQQ